MTETTHVRLVQVPVTLMGQWGEHQQELLREFTLIQLSDPAAKADIPSRLLEVIEQHRPAFNRLSVRTRGQFARAREEHEQYIDLELDLPPGAPDAARELRALFDEADEFCRRGDLLTLATPPEYVALRQWFLDEIVRQFDGQAPIAFTDAQPG
jgi:hypothetical protein